MAGQMGGELQFIVDRLNDPPFQMQLTMVAFDEKSPFELLEVVNEVMANLSSQHRIDLRDETPDATATRMLEFMRVLNYKISIEMQQAKAALLAERVAHMGPSHRAHFKVGGGGLRAGRD